MVGIMTNTEPVTLINVFEVPQDELDAFAADWHTRAEFMSRQPGFRSFRLHRALAPDSKFQLVNVAEWDSAEALQTALAQPEFQAGDPPRRGDVLDHRPPRAVPRGGGIHGLKTTLRPGR